jgi:hypothetical protein
MQLRRRAATAPWDPFAVNPVRRSFAAFVICSAAFIVPMAAFPENLEALTMVMFGWLAAIGMVLTFPIFLMSLAELAWAQVARRLYPSVDLLDVSPRVRNLLNRYGFRTIEGVDRTSDDAFLMLTNFDPKALHELRRAISIWKYRRWQDAGFPASWT